MMAFEVGRRTQARHTRDEIGENMNAEKKLFSLVSNEIDDSYTQLAIERAKKHGILLGPNTNINADLCNLSTLDIGRLGNYIYTYITSLLLSEEFNIQPCISEVSYGLSCDDDYFDPLIYCTDEEGIFIGALRRGHRACSER